MRPRSFLVIGPESSGTKMMTRFLLDAGCSRLAEQGYLGNYPVYDGTRNLVVHRSMPYAGKWESMPELIGKLSQQAPFGAAVVMLRSWPATISSQQNHKHARGEQAEWQTRWALGHIFSGLQGVPFYPITYASAVSDDNLLRWLYTEFGMVAPDPLPRRDNRDARHY